MSGIQPSVGIDIRSKMKEADVYYSMELFEESLGVYLEIASSNSDIDPQSMKTINEKIDQLKKKIADIDKTKPNGMSSSHVDIVKQELSSQGNVNEALHSASALKELGLIEEAIVQYEKLLTNDCSSEAIIPELSACLIKTLSPSKVIKRIEERSVIISWTTKKWPRSSSCWVWRWKKEGIKIWPLIYSRIIADRS